MGLSVKNISFSYGDKEVLRDISFHVKPGQLLGLLGPNGVGKTTLLKCINKIHTPEKGEIYIEGKRVDNLSERDLAHHLSYVPQSTHSNFPISVVDMVMLGRLPFIGFALGKKDKSVIFDLLEELDLAHMAFEPINRLSGGERQRVFIARAIAQEPKVILLDEPTSNLDMKHQIEILRLLKTIIRENKMAAVMTVHDLNLAGLFCDKVVMLKDQEIYASGDSHQVLNEANIQSVYGVKTQIHKRNGKHQILLVDDGL
jgi:iron complex transport system ATP-binding protein